VVADRLPLRFVEVGPLPQELLLNVGGAEGVEHLVNEPVGFGAVGQLHEQHECLDEVAPGAQIAP
jgi:hypothetical protein